MELLLLINYFIVIFPRTPKNLKEKNIIII